MAELDISDDNSRMGASAAEVISDLSGSDRFWGSTGNDILISDSGEDVFSLDTTLSSRTRVDVIKASNVADNMIRLNDAVLTKLSDTRQLRSFLFREGEKALDSNDSIAYNKTPSAFHCDTGESGAAAVIKFAVSENNALLTAVDFVVI